jgi:transposase
MPRQKGTKNTFQDETEQIDRAVTLFQEGNTPTAIAKELGWDPKTVRKYLRQRQVLPPGRKAPNRPNIADRVEPFLPLIHERYTQGELIADLAKEYKIARSYLYELLQKHDYAIKSIAEENRSVSRLHIANRYGVGPFEFIDAWQTSNSVDEVAQRLNMPKKTVCSRAGNYRRRGIELQLMNVSKYDWTELREFAELFLHEDTDND